LIVIAKQRAYDRNRSWEVASVDVVAGFLGY